MKTVSRAFWSGLLATSHMTTFMMLAHRKLPERQRSPLPPAILAHQFLPPLAGSSARQNSSLVSHFFYGFVLAGVYSVLPQSRGDSPLVRGAVYGLGVWAANYLLLLPAIGARSQAFTMPPARNGLMVFAHLLWGATLGGAYAQLREESLLDGSVKRAGAE